MLPLLIYQKSTNSCPTQQHLEVEESVPIGITSLSQTAATSAETLVEESLLTIAHMILVA